MRENQPLLPHQHPDDGGKDLACERSRMLANGFRSPYQAPRAIDVMESWSEWQDLNLRPPRPERGARRGGVILMFCWKARLGKATLAK